jgi:hypothetical protein
MAIHDTATCLAKFKGAHDVLPGFNPDSIPSRLRFLTRRVKLLKNLLLWRKYKDQYGIDVLVGRLVDVCIIEVAQGGWTVGGQDIVRQVCHFVRLVLRIVLITHSVDFQAIAQRINTTFPEDPSISWLVAFLPYQWDNCLVFSCFSSAFDQRCPRVATELLDGANSLGIARLYRIWTHLKPSKINSKP